MDDQLKDVLSETVGVFSLVTKKAEAGSSCGQRPTVKTMYKEADKDFKCESKVEQSCRLTQATFSEKTKDPFH